MVSDNIANRDIKSGTQRRDGQKKSKPEWADGLRQIYDSVLEEPLPDSFNDLLSKLDDPA